METLPVLKAPVADPGTALANTTKDGINTEHHEHGRTHPHGHVHVLIAVIHDGIAYRGVKRDRTQRPKLAAQSASTMTWRENMPTPTSKTAWLIFFVLGLSWPGYSAATKCGGNESLLEFAQRSTKIPELRIVRAKVGRPPFDMGEDARVFLIESYLDNKSGDTAGQFIHMRGVVGYLLSLPPEGLNEPFEMGSEWILEVYEGKNFRDASACGALLQVRDGVVRGYIKPLFRPAPEDEDARVPDAGQTMPIDELRRCIHDVNAEGCRWPAIQPRAAIRTLRYPLAGLKASEVSASLTSGPVDSRLLTRRGAFMIDSAKDQLIVTDTDAAHKKIGAMLERLLQGGRE